MLMIGWPIFLHVKLPTFKSINLHILNLHDMLELKIPDSWYFYGQIKGPGTKKKHACVKKRTEIITKLLFFAALYTGFDEPFDLVY